MPKEPPEKAARRRLADGLIYHLTGANAHDVEVAIKLVELYDEARDARRDDWHLAEGDNMPEEGVVVQAYHPDWGVREGARAAGGIIGMWASNVLATHWRPMNKGPK